MGVNGVHTAVTYDELAQLVQVELDRGYQPTRAGRRRLLALIEEMRDAVSEEPSGLLEGRAWRLASITVRGIGGIDGLEPPTLELTPTAGLTVIRSPNGHGKTSLARATESALRGERHEADDVSGDLWSAQLLSEGAEHASVEVVLVSSSDRLDLQVSFAAAGDRVRAVLTEASGSRSVQLDRSWHEALLGSRACYSYSVLQTRLKSDRDLQGYLEELLVLGPIWQSVRTALVRRAEDATVAKKAVEKVCATAKAAEASLRERFLADPRSPIVPRDILWPSAWTDDIDEWLVTNELTCAVDERPIPVPDDYERQVETLRSALHVAEQCLSAAESALDDPRHGAILDHLQALVGSVDLDDERCPVCGSAVAWRYHVRAVVSGARQRRSAAAEVEGALRALADWSDGVLVPLTHASAGGPDIEVRTLRDAVQTGGCRAHSPAHRAAGILLTALAGDRHREWVMALRRSSDASAEWARDRVRIVEPLLTAWRTHGDRAAEADCWKVAEKTLDELQVRLRQDRQDDVTAQLHVALRAMLPDADVEIEKIHHQGGAKNRRGAQVRLTLGGRPARLGMLSSGQRNALLLAPLLVLATGGPFGFLLIDDPVHALDDLRVDHLARELARLADSYQVLVLTHDPRLEEHLRARRPDLATVTLDRNVATRTVRCTHLSTPWETLLADATQVRDIARQDGWLNDASQESIVTGLCRAALDGAIRQAAINRAVRHAMDVDEALRALVEARDTRARVEHVFALAGGSGTLPTVRMCVDTFLPAWNSGAHGGPAVGLDLKAHIRTARRACAELIRHQW